jgi:hypothetical protein
METGAYEVLAVPKAPSACSRNFSSAIHRVQVCVLPYGDPMYELWRKEECCALSLLANWFDSLLGVYVLVEINVFRHDARNDIQPVS